MKIPGVWLSVLLLSGGGAVAGEYVAWEAEGFAITRPLGGLRGDATRGRALVAARDKGNCIACHQLPIPEEPDHGTLAPPLAGVASRLSVAEIRLRVVDEKRVNPDTIMPAFHRDPATYYRALPTAGGPILTAQEVEDVVAYVATLR